MTTVFSNIDNQAPIGPVHALSPGTWLSCVRPAISQEAHAGITIDQIAAQHIGQDTPLPSLEVATDVRGGGGFCDRDYGCSYAGTISFRTPTTPLPMETDPRKLFIRLFGQGDNAAERARLSKQYGSLLDMLTSEVNDAAAQPGAVGQAGAVRLSRDRPRNRAPHSEDGGARPVARRHPGRAGRHAALRSAHQPDVRPGRAGVSGEHDARLHLHDGGRGQRPDLQPHRRVRRVPSAVAPQQRAGEDGPPGQGADVPHAGVREVPRQARGHAGWRRDDARSFAVPLWQQHEQQQRPQPLSAADVVRRRLEDGEGQPARGAAGEDAARERAADVPRQDQRRRRTSWATAPASWWRSSRVREIPGRAGRPVGDGADVGPGGIRGGRH